MFRAQMFTVTLPVATPRQRAPLWFVFELDRQPCEEELPAIARIDVYETDPRGADARIYVEGLEPRRFPLALHREIAQCLLARLYPSP
jgi:hypothetical protein